MTLCPILVKISKTLLSGFQGRLFSLTFCHFFWIPFDHSKYPLNDDDSPPSSSVSLAVTLFHHISRQLHVQITLAPASLNAIVGVTGYQWYVAIPYLVCVVLYSRWPMKLPPSQLDRIPPNKGPRFQEHYCPPQPERERERESGRDREWEREKETMSEWERKRPRI